MLYHEARILKAYPFSNPPPPRPRPRIAERGNTPAFRNPQHMSPNGFRVLGEETLQHRQVGLGTSHSEMWPVPHSGPLQQRPAQRTILGGLPSALRRQLLVTNRIFDLQRPGCTLSSMPSSIESFGCRCTSCALLL